MTHARSPKTRSVWPVPVLALLLAAGVVACQGVGPGWEPTQPGSPGTSEPGAAGGGAAADQGGAAADPTTGGATPAPGTDEQAAATPPQTESPDEPAIPGEPAAPGDPAALGYLRPDDVPAVIDLAPEIHDFLLLNPAALEALRANLAAALLQLDGRTRAFFYGLGTAVSFPGPSVNLVSGRYVYRTADGVLHDVPGTYQAAGLGMGFQFQHVLFLGFVADREGAAPALEATDLDGATFTGIAAHLKECPPWLAGSIEQYQSEAVPLDLYVGTTGCGPAAPLGLYCQQATLDLTP